MEIIRLGYITGYIVVPFVNKDCIQWITICERSQGIGHESGVVPLSTCEINTCREKIQIIVDEIVGSDADNRYIFVFNDIGSLCV